MAGNTLVNIGVQRFEAILSSMNILRVHPIRQLHRSVSQPPWSPFDICFAAVYVQGLILAYTGIAITALLVNSVPLLFGKKNDMLKLYFFVKKWHIEKRKEYNKQSRL